MLSFEQQTDRQSVFATLGYVMLCGFQRLGPKHDVAKLHLEDAKQK